MGEVLTPQMTDVNPNRWRSIVLSSPSTSQRSPWAPSLQRLSPCRQRLQSPAGLKNPG